MATKPKIKPKVKKPDKTTGQDNILPDGSILDLSAFGEFSDLKLTPRESRFVAWYCYPGSDAFQNQTRAAVRAGYEKKTAYAAGYKTRNHPKVVEAIRRIMERGTVDLEEKYQRVLQLLERRAFFNMADYVKRKKVSVKVGKDKFEQVDVEVLKDLEELTPEQLQAIDGVDYKGPKSIRVYLMADRQKVIADIINMRNKVNGSKEDGGYDIDSIAEIIGHIAMKSAERKKREGTLDDSKYIKLPPGGERVVEL
jgi:phage terminase small subunit